MPEKLYLIGTVHVDLKGYRRVTKLLNTILPDNVSIEYSPSLFNATIIPTYADIEPRVQNAIKKYKDHNPNVETARKLVELSSYEVNASLNYCWSHGRMLWMDEDLSKIKFRLDGKEGLANDFFRQAIIMDVQNLSSEIEAMYNAVTRPEVLNQVLKKDPNFQKIFESFENRDAVREARIRQMNGTVVAIAGLNHIFGTYNNLYERLNDLNPTRMTLADVDHMSQKLTAASRINPKQNRF